MVRYQIPNIKRCRYIFCSKNTHLDKKCKSNTCQLFDTETFKGQILGCIIFDNVSFENCSMCECRMRNERIKSLSGVLFEDARKLLWEKTRISVWHEKLMWVHKNLYKKYAYFCVYVCLSKVCRLLKLCESFLHKMLAAFCALNIV